MVVVRDEQRIARLKKMSQTASLVGFLLLVGGFFVVFLNVQNLIFYQTLALVGGWILSQVGLYLAHRYLRSPRPDEVLDEAVRKAVRDGRMYHYVISGAPHVLLTPAGPIVFVLKYQSGKISADGDKWKQRGVGLRRFFGQEGLGNPTKEAESMVKSLASYIRGHAPNVEEVLIGAMIVFTTKHIENLDVKDSQIPAMHYSKVRGFLKQKGRGERLPREDYEALRQAFDEAAGEAPDGE